VADGDAEAEHLLQLELDRRADLGQLVRQVLRVRDRGRELAGWRGRDESASGGEVDRWRITRTLGETGAEETRDLLDEGLGGEEGVVLLRELLDELLVLVEPAGTNVSMACNQNEERREGRGVDGHRK
jgi:hypothetical protein